MLERNSDIVPLALFKEHVRADDLDCDDNYLLACLRTAESFVIRMTNRTVEELTALNGGCFPLELVQAIMLVAGHWYNQREAVGISNMSEVPYTVQSLVKPFRKLGRGDER